MTVELVVHRRWWTDTQPLRASLPVRYEPGDKRSTGYLDPADWGSVLTELEHTLGVRFTIVAFQGYQDGTAGTDWHSDDYPHQAMLSIGATRTFGVRLAGHETAIPVDDGDLVYLAGRQEHAVLTDPGVSGERCSLVFRSNP